VESKAELLAAAPEQDFKLIPAAVDLKTNKTQVTVGVAAALAVASAITLGSQITATSGITALVLFSGSLLTGLITAEITGAYGSRLGGAPAAWAAILFAVSPWSRQAVEAAGSSPVGLLPAWLCVQLYLLAMFSFLRFRNTQERGHLRLALLAAAAVLFTRVEAATLPFAVLAAEVLLPVNDPAGKKTRKVQNWIAAALFFLVLSFVGTAGRLAPQMVPMLHVPVQGWFGLQNLNELHTSMTPLLRFAYGLVLLGAAFFGNLRVAAFAAAWTAVASANLSIVAAPLAILLACCGLPATNAVNLRTARVTTIVGSIALTMVAVGWLIAARQ
jgi:hypothetical protein